MFKEDNDTYNLEDDGSNLFIDDEPKDDAEDNEQPANSEPSAEETPTPSDDEAEDSPVEGNEAAQPQTIRVKVKGREIDVSAADALNPELVRKGMAFDDVYAELEQLRSAHSQTDSSLREVEKWAQQAGMELTEYIDYLRTTRRAQDVEREVNSIRQKYPDIPEEAAKEMAETRIKEKDAKEQQTAQQRKTEAEKAEQKPWEDFVQKYPTMDSWEKIPADVVAEIESGASPVEAMQRHEMRELQKQIADLNTKIGQLEQNKKNKEAALPSASSTRDTEPKDAFLEGLGF